MYSLNLTSIMVLASIGRPKVDQAMGFTPKSQCYTQTILFKWYKI